jgi:hypothetical protein
MARLEDFADTVCKICPSSRTGSRVPFALVGIRPPALGSESGGSRVLLPAALPVPQLRFPFRYYNSSLRDMFCAGKVKTRLGSYQIFPISKLEIRAYT